MAITEVGARKQEKTFMYSCGGRVKEVRKCTFSVFVECIFKAMLMNQIQVKITCSHNYQETANFWKTLQVK